MTYIDEAEVRRPSRGTKVLAFGCGILAILGSFWGIVWFIRSYVEPPRVMRPSPLALASRDSVPVAPPASIPARRNEPIADRAMTVSAAADPAERAVPTGAIADRWAPLSHSTPAAMPAMAPPRAITAAAPATADIAPAPPMAVAPALSAATLPDAAEIDDVVERWIPAIPGPAPLPRRRPAVTAMTVKRTAEPPLPRPRPDGPAPQSVFTAVPVSDDRFPTQ